MPNLIREVCNLGTVWYNPESLANILSLAEVPKKFRVTMDTSIKPALSCMRWSDGSVMKFTKFKSELHYFDMNNKSETLDNQSSNQFNAYSFITTVAKNQSIYHWREVEAANYAQKLYRMIGRPSIKQFKDILMNNSIHNCPVTVDDACRAVKIWGLDMATHIKRKAMKGPAMAVPLLKLDEIPAPILECHKDVTLCMDLFFVQGQTFLYTISQKKFCTLSVIENQHKAPYKKR